MEVICSNSPVVLYRAFYDALRALVQSRGEYRILVPNLKCGINIAEALIKDRSMPQSFQQSRFATFKTVCNSIIKETAPEARIINETSCKEILKDIVGREGKLSPLDSIKECAGLYDNLYKLIMKFKENGFVAGGDQSNGAPIDVSRSFFQIYRKYNEYLKNKCALDEADVMSLAKKNIARSKSLSKIKTLLVFGFAHFPAFEESLLAELSKKFDRSYIYMLYDSGSGFEQRYSYLNGTMSRLQKHGAVIKHLNDEKYYENNNLNYLKENIFISFKEKDVFDESDASVSILSADGALEEASVCAAEIKALIDSRKYAPSEIAIIVRDKSGYAPHIMSAFDEYGIPASLDNEIALWKLNIIHTLLLPIRLVADDFTRDDLISFLNSGYVQLGDDIDIGGGELTLMKAGFVRGAKSCIDKLASLEIAQKDDRNVYSNFTAQIRVYLSGFFDFISQNIKPEDTLSNYKTALKSVLEVKFSIKERIVNSLRDTAPNLIKRDIDAYDKFFKAFDDIIRAYNIAGKSDKKIEVAYLLNLLLEQIKKVSALDEVYGARDTEGQSVSIFTPEEFFFDDYKAIFFMNMTEGSFPSRVKPSFLLGGAPLQHERFSFLPKNEDILNADKALFYRIIALCGEKLYLTYSVSGGQVSASGRSPFLDDVSLLLEGTGGARSIERERAIEDDSKDVLLEKFFTSIGSRADESMKSLYNYLVTKSGDNDFYRRIFGNVIIERERDISDDFTSYEGNIAAQESDISDFIKNALVGKFHGKIFSASQIDEFANCPISYFFNRILKLKSLLPPDVSVPASIRGSILHDILFEYFSATSLSGAPYDEDNIEKTAHKYFDENSAEYTAQNPRMMEIEKRGIIRTLRQVIKFELEQRQKAEDKLEKAKIKYEEEFAKSAKSRAKGTLPKYFIDAQERYLKAQDEPRLEPTFFEYGFGVEKSKSKSSDPAENVDREPFLINLPDGASILLRGYIDRIDVDHDSRKYAIIDYKSGNAPINADVLIGASLQLPLYDEYVRSVLLKDYEPTCNVFFLLKEIKHSKINAVFNDVKPFLVEYLKMMKDGRYYSRPNKECKSWCAFTSICRYDKETVAK